MKKNTKKQFIKIFKGKVYIFILLFIFCFFRLAYNLSFNVTEFFVDWTSHPYFEIERILVSAVITFIFTHFLVMSSKRKFLKLAISKLYSCLCRIYLTNNNMIICKLIECFINIIFKGDFLTVKEQSHILEEILLELFEISKGNIAAHLFIISGDAHSGKTILAKKLINDIFTKEKYVQLFRKYNKSIFYYDFSCLGDGLEEIIKNYDNNYYDNYFLIFDNLHKLNDNQIKKLLKKIIREPDNAKCVLMLTRNINHIIEGELISEIDEKRKNHILITPRLSVLNFDDEYDFSSGFLEFTNELNLSQNLLNNNYIKFHLYYIYNIYKKNKNTLIKKLFHEMNKENYSDPIVKGFIFICCSALFTGTVDKKIIKKWIGRKNVILYLKTYIDMGVLNGFHGIETWEYSIHEKTARSYIQCICKNSEGSEICKNFFHFIFLNIKNELKYRYSIPFKEIYNINLFDQIVNKGHFQIIYEDILYIIEIFNLNKQNFGYELSVLNDRIGNFTLTKENILDLYNNTKNQKYLILLLHSDHTMFYHKDFYDIYNDMMKSNNIYIRFATNYWVLHIKMHQGKWNLDTYLRLCEILPDNLDAISNESYETSHVLRRFYFDCFRIYYLLGKNDFKCFNNLMNKIKKIKLYLNQKLDEFKIYECKFIYAHYIHYELLFKYYVLDKCYINQEEISFFDCNDTCNLIEKAVEYYYKAYNYFYDNKDKTYYYVLLRLCELAPGFVLHKIKNILIEEVSVEEFTQKEYKEILGIFDQFRDKCGIAENMIEYAAYAETFKMKFVLICKISNTTINIDFDKVINLCAKKAIEYHKLYNIQNFNEYGILRVKLLKSINDFLINQQYNTFYNELTTLLDYCIAKKYNREIALIKSIQKMKSRIEQKRLYDVIRFYPIVLQ